MKESDIRDLVLNAFATGWSNGWADGQELQSAREWGEYPTGPVLWEERFAILHGDTEEIFETIPIERLQELFM